MHPRPTRRRRRPSPCRRPPSIRSWCGSTRSRSAARPCATPRRPAASSSTASASLRTPLRPVGGGGREAQGRGVLRRLRPRGRGNTGIAAGHLLVQRGSGLLVGVDAPRPAGTAPGAASRRRLGRRAAVRAGRQPARAPRRHRSGVHRPAEHRLQPRRSGRDAAGVPRLRRRRRERRRLHSPVDRPIRPLVVAEVPDR